MQEEQAAEDESKDEETSEEATEEATEAAEDAEEAEEEEDEEEEDEEDEEEIVDPKETLEEGPSKHFHSPNPSTRSARLSSAVRRGISLE